MTLVSEQTEVWGGGGGGDMYLFIDLPEEVDLVGQTLKLGLQLNLVHVGLIHVLPHAHKHTVRETLDVLYTIQHTHTIGMSKVKETTVCIPSD